MNLISMSALLAFFYSFALCKPVQVATRNNEMDSDTTLHEGDIVLRRKRNAINCDSSCFWPKSRNGLVNVPVNVSTEFSVEERTWIVEAMQEFTTLTCVQFINHTTETNYISIVPGERSVPSVLILHILFSCWSHFGKIGGMQQVGLMKTGCMSKGAIQHEMNHALGFLHEQARSDRDNYVKIMWQYIMAGEQGNFGKVNSNNLGLPYDYSSVMHYGLYDFSNTSGKATIVPIPDPSVPIGQREGLSNLDVAKINKLYSCNCCSNVLHKPADTFSSVNYPSSYPDNSNCLWLIRIPQHQVFLQFDAFDLQPSPDCTSDYIRIYDGSSRNSSVLLDKLCGMGSLPSLVASRNVMLVEFVSDEATAATGFQASYSQGFFLPAHKLLICSLTLSVLFLFFLVKCGSTLTGTSGVITSPNYPNRYPKNQDCFWVISAPADVKISLIMVFFELEDIDECKYDYLLIHDGSQPTSPAVGPYCGTMQIADFTSSENSVLVEFHSDVAWVFPGFMLNYSFVMPS
ncbi:astacin-like metalloendopeptidase [Chelonoidis abingdonii]|uniref:astacin-like metalloendopeptidase n=1 Tax=Chelonoidis abingdonii TaxID=106734 RepID=UPI003F499BF7